ncbi:uncharacterized protein FMAN_03650 [Fusarium mangiferae]|uniref:Thiamine pyrophosphate enzyme TPP-binding domain-containing protein n=1 Tax=Fusarium mangiferae TaxID=192010 RepID=A0A1L7TH42_FUSMA|nr:uncharacterized protein FMAN_03650 [Fusarium mangiferae]CVK94627.1 uncharacterized protein FMAN_03650 [Fusarium mangiferae]
MSGPQGPSYLIASREALEENIAPYTVNDRKWKPLAPQGLAPVVVDEIVASVISAKSPVVITTYLGRDTEAVPELVKLCEALRVAEALPAYMNSPHDHYLYVGNHWSEGLPNGILDNADVVLVLDCDVPWIKSVFRPCKDAKLYHIDCNPLKVNTSLFHINPGTYLTSGATALGWHGGAAIGFTMTHPGRLVVAVTGDGSFMFSIPSTVYWMARRYNIPFLTVILNNRGRKSLMLSALAVHKNRHSSRMAQADDLHVTFNPSCDHSQIAVAAGADWGTSVKETRELDAAIAKGIEVVHSGRAAIVNIWLLKFNVSDRVFSLPPPKRHR